MCDRIQQHERMMRYIHHREKVLDMESVVKAQILRSCSAPPRKNTQKQVESRRRIDLENERLMKSLLNISARFNQNVNLRRSETPVTASRRRTTKEARKLAKEWNTSKV